MCILRGHADCRGIVTEEYTSANFIKATLQSPHPVETAANSRASASVLFGVRTHSCNNNSITHTLCWCLCTLGLGTGLPIPVAAQLRAIVVLDISPAPAA